MQFDPHALRLTPPQSDRGVPYAHDKGIPAGARLGEDLDLLAVHETELEETPLERRQGRGTGPDAHYAPTGARRQGSEARKARRAAQTFGDSNGIHDVKYG
jgi:hypothetical protein